MEARAYQFGVHWTSSDQASRSLAQQRRAPRNDRFQSRDKAAETPPTLERGPLGKDNARCSASEPAFDIRGSTPAATMLSSTSFSSCFLLLLAAQVVTMRFGAIATGPHRAPAAAAVLAVIHEQPAALVVQTMPQPPYFRTHDQVASRPQHRCEQARRAECVAIDAPSESLLAMCQHAPFGCAIKRRVNRGHVARLRRFAVSHCKADSIDRLAQSDRVVKDSGRIAAVFFLPLQRVLRCLAREHRVRVAPAHHLREIVDGFDRFAAAAVARVGEVDAEVSAGRDDRARGLAGTIHSTDILTIKGVDIKLPSR